MKWVEYSYDDNLNFTTCRKFSQDNFKFPIILIFHEMFVIVQIQDAEQVISLMMK